MKTCVRMIVLRNPHVSGTIFGNCQCLVFYHVLSVLFKLARLATEISEASVGFPTSDSSQ